MGALNRLISTALFAACLFIGYQSYNNARDSEDIRDLAVMTACDVGASCVLKHKDPMKIKTNVTGRQYEFSTSVGRVTVDCSRTYIWLGLWACKSTVGGLPAPLGSDY